MKIPRRQFLRLAAGAAVLPAVSRVARAQTYPTRPVKIIVPVAPGGGTDVIGRIMAEQMRATLGQPVIIENVAGGAGSVGVGRVAHAAQRARVGSLGSSPGGISVDGEAGACAFAVRVGNPSECLL
jgi:tripartite-type tricarboxylate transporter receptor subunit TctC